MMKVKFVPQNVEFSIEPGQCVMHVAQDHDLYIKSVCKGVPSCAECRVRVVDGEHNVLPPGSEELLLIGTGHFIDRRRLSCQLKCFGDITVDLTEQLAKQQGLITGQKKKKLAIKDDRIEDQHAIRAESPAEEGSEEGSDESRQATQAPRQESRGVRRPEKRPSPGPQVGAAGPPQPRPQQPSRPPGPAAAGSEGERSGKPRRKRRRGGGGGGAGGTSGGGPGRPPRGNGPPPGGAAT